MAAQHNNIGFQPVASTPVIQTHNVEEAKYFLMQLRENNSGNCWMNSSASSSHFFLRYYQAPLPIGHIGYVQWQGYLQLHRVQPDGFYLIYFPLEGQHHETIDGNEPLIISCDQAMILSPRQSSFSQATTEGQGILLYIPRAAVKQELTTLLNASIHPAVIFEPALDLTQSVGASLKRLALFLWEEANQADTAKLTLLTSIVKSLITTLLQSHPHCYSPLLMEGTPPSVCEQHVQTAKEFMAAHLEQSIAVGDIAAAVGVSTRALQRAFARHEQRSPMQCLTQMRLDAVRAALLHASSTTQVTGIMMRYGFVHSGNFAQLYRRAFGECPRDTLQRSRHEQRSLPSVG